MPKISVIIPCFNSKEHIVECIKSLGKQEFKDFDVILIDDCSNDNSVEIAKEEAKKYNLNLQVLFNEKNLGPSLTRKKGIEKSESEYIAFCDSDDFYEPDLLSKMFFATENESKDIVFCNYSSIYSNGKVVKHDVVSNIKEFSKEQRIACGHDSLCSMLTRKALLDISFPDIRNGEDMAIIPLIISKAETFGFVEDSLYNYRYHKGALSKTKSSTMVNNLELSFEYIKNILGDKYVSEVEFLGIRNLLYGGILNLLKHENSFSKAKAIKNCFVKEFPNWEKNKYYYLLPKYKKIFLEAIKHNLYFSCRCFALVHRFISK